MEHESLDWKCSHDGIGADCSTRAGQQRGCQGQKIRRRIDIGCGELMTRCPHRVIEPEAWDLVMRYLDAESMGLPVVPPGLTVDDTPYVEVQIHRAIKRGFSEGREHKRKIQEAEDKAQRRVEERNARNKSTTATRTGSGFRKARGNRGR